MQNFTPTSGFAVKHLVDRKIHPRFAIHHSKLVSTCSTRRHGAREHNGACTLARSACAYAPFEATLYAILV